MAAPTMHGGYPLNNEKIDEKVTKKSAGCYKLGNLNSRDRVEIKYVGRSDSDVSSRLKDHVGKYTHFFFAYTTSPKAAFEAECELYHDYSPKNNTIHPDRPANSSWKCPRCNNFS